MKEDGYSVWVGGSSCLLIQKTNQKSFNSIQGCSLCTNTLGKGMNPLILALSHHQIFC